MKTYHIEEDKFNLVRECLACLKEIFLMLDKIPMKKAKKMKSKQIMQGLDELIVYLNNLD